MFIAFLLAAALASSGVAATREAPSYSAAGIVNSASNQAGFFAPNTFITIYGTGLARSTRAIADSDIEGNTLPGILPGTGVNVFINRIRAHVYYVSPQQINVLIPSDALPGPAELQISLDSLYGPAIPITLQAAAPALFQSDAQTAIALHGDGKLLTASAPGKPGEWVTLFATGLGATSPPAMYAEIPVRAAPLREVSRFRIWVGDTEVEAGRIGYAGVAPGFAGLYQINLRLPDTLPRNAEVRIQAGDISSKSGVFMPTEP